MQPLQTRFDGGEISPRLSGRFDSDLYKKALKQSKNFEPLAQGSLRMRSGSGMSQTLTGDASTRIIRIRTSIGSDYIAELLDNKMHLYAIDGGSATGVGSGGGGPNPVGIIELTTNGDFSQLDGLGWNKQIFGIAGFSGVYFRDFTVSKFPTGVCQIDNGAGPGFAIVYQAIAVPNPSDIDVAFDVVGALNTTMRVKVSSTPPSAWADQNGGGDLFQQDVAGNNLINNTIPGVIPPSQSGTVGTVAGGFDRVDLGSFNLPAPQTIYLSFQMFNGAAPGCTWFIDSVNLTAKLYGGTGAPGITDIPTPWSAGELPAIKYDTEPGRDRTIFTHPGHQRWALTWGGVGGAWSYGPVPFNPIPLGWGDAGSTNIPGAGGHLGTWNWLGQTGKLAAPNWPACVQVHAGRIYYAGEPAQKNRIVASKANDPDNFTTGTNPGDPLDFKIATKGGIRWLSSYRTLLAGTDLGHYSITGSTGVPLVGDLQARQESGFNGASIQAVTAGTQALFVMADLRRIRATSYDIQTSGWEAKDLTFAAEHISAGLIKEIHHAWTPDSMVIALMQDGTAALCNFEPAEQVLSWWTINVGAPISSCATAQGPNGAYLWMAVNRNGIETLERLSLSESSEALQYLDSYKNVAAVAAVLPDGSPGVTIAGLAHLQGLAVYCVYGGIVVPGVVDKTGTLTLSDVQTGGQSIAGQTVTVGVNYLARAVTLGRNTKTGRARSSKIGLVLNNSRIPKINGKRGPDRSPKTFAGNVDALITGKVTIVNLGWSDGDEITIEQDIPFRTEVCAIYALTEVTE